ncbi:MAG TPA: SOS response-associated peptidase [Pyrinomonadaceae bacterium]|jgi:putative SOS response-associated peptidase YedK|nr:SOS response-associated peptidase [Pyrinomonadaceae bacterium]
MCGRFTLKQPRRIPIINFDDADLPTLPPRYNIAPTQDVLTVVERENSREARMLQWGLIPFWSKEPKGIINARVETIAEKASFNESFQKRRCLIFADGFYEWERNGKISQPYYFQLKDGEPFAFAGVWDKWRANDRVITSCAIITTKANELLSTIHTRMPVILPPELYDFWLNEDSREPELKEILMPFPASEMISHAVSYDVNDVKNEGEHLVRRVEPNIGVNLKLF